MDEIKPTGFTLLELSIVLIIVAFIAGGIIVGRNMIRAGEVRSILTDAEAYQTAFNSFELKYNELPGDMKDASAYWGLAGGTSTPHNPACFTAQTAGSIATCNGDGDGQIGTSLPPVVSNTDEWFLVWKHLSNAGMVAGNFTGQSGPAGVKNAVPGVNVAGSKIGSAGFGAYYYPPNGWGSWPGTWNNILLFGREYPGDFENAGNVLTPTEALSIDSKMDDGAPGRGKLRVPPLGWAGVEGPCSTTDDQTTAVYNTSLSAQACRLYWLDVFR